MDTALLFQQIRLINPATHTDQVVDLWLEDNQIKAIEPHLPDVPETVHRINGQGLIFAPGLVDLYSSSGEIGYEERETLQSLSQSAIAGGYTRLNLLPNFNPALDHPSVLALLRSKVPATIQFSFWGNLTQRGRGAEMTELGELASAGVVGFSDGKAIENLGLLRRLLEYSKPLGKPILLRGKSSTLQGKGVMRDGNVALRVGLVGDPDFSEAVAIASILELVAALKTPVHLMNVSTERGVDLICQAKENHLPVTASTAWLYLLLNTKALSSYDPNLRLDPPLGNPADQKALIKGVKTGVIDAIAVDHTPYTYEEKTVAFGEAPCGAIGLELILPLLWHTFVETEEWSALELWQKLSSNPALCLNQSPPSCTVGNPAEFIIFDPQKTWLVNGKTLKSLARNTFWLNQELTGKVIPLTNLR